MKRVLIVVGILMISILFVNPVSANWFTGWFGWGEDNDLEGELASLTDKCIDSDNGKNYEEFGVVVYNGWFRQKRYEDYCRKERLYEYYCNDRGKVKKEKKIRCENGCLNGACINKATGCVDSDGGVDYSVRGNVEGLYKDPLTNEEVKEWVRDFCLDGPDTSQSDIQLYIERGIITESQSNNENLLIEHSCNGEYIVTEGYECLNGCSDGACINQAELVYDEVSGIYVEQGIKEGLDSLYNKMNLCTDCNNLPQPTISLSGGNKSAIYNLYFHNKKVRSFILPFPSGEKEIINNPENVLSEPSWIRVDGTNSIEFLIPYEGNFFQNRYDILVPNQETNIRYKIIKKEGNYGSAYFFVLEDNNILDLNEIIQTFDNIAEDNSNLVGLENTEPYYVLAMPTIFAGLFGGEGNFYMGNNLINLNLGGEKYYDLYGQGALQGSMSHEYVHLLEFKPETGQYAISDNGFFMEGLADAVSIFNGYRQWTDLIEDPLEPGCSHIVNQHSPHALGRCIFKHLDQEGFLNEAFFNRLFHLSGESYLVYTCDANLQDTLCTSELNKLLSEGANQNMTSFMENILLANMSAPRNDYEWPPVTRNDSIEEI